MKKAFPVLIISVLIITVFSCKNKTEDKKVEDKPAQNLTELTTKYSEMKFANCDEFLAAGDEIIDVYIKTVDKAYNGDAQAKVDLEEFEIFMAGFDEKAEKFSEECPEKFDDWALKTDQRVAAVTDKLVKIFYNEYEGLQWDEELDKELEKQMDELNEDLKKVADEENKLNSQN
ncbi:MAG: hypothetical protein PHE56_10315 [Bacteroidales bacterium]|jgi:hypothetical protein|nr:hypothetical protein [Bacteroidales bacterium]